MIVQNKTLRDFNFASQPVNDLYSIDWTDIKAIQISESGSAKVIFVETQQGAIVLKGTGEVGVDFFLNQLAQQTKVLCPKMRVVGWKEPEFEEIVLGITAAAHSNEILSYRLEQRLEIAFFQIIQYISGMSLQYLGYKLIPKLFQVDDINGRKRMLSLGRIYAFDLFLNNCDRYPLNIWPNEGNSENLLLKFISNDFVSRKDNDPSNLQFENFYAIDHRMILSNDSQIQNTIIEKYQNKLIDFIEHIFQSVNEQDGALDFNQNEIDQVLSKFKQLIYAHSHYDVTVQSQFHIILGMIQGFKDISDFGFINFQKLQQKIKINEIMDWEGNFNENLQRIHMKFYQKQFEIINNCLSKNKIKVAICVGYLQ